MDFQKLLQKKEAYLRIKDTLPEITVKSYEKAFELANTHHSTAIEGNTLTLLETKVVIEEGLSVGGKKLRELYEVINHHKAYQFIKSCISKGIELDETIIKEIRAMLMENIMIGGIYRNVGVYYDDMALKKNVNAIELAAWTHQLMTHGFLPITIKKESRLEYFDALEAYAVNGVIQPFAEMIAALEEEQLDIYFGMLV